MAKEEEDGTIGLGNYLLTRLVELGAQTIQGVPGDYNMGFLDLIEDHDKLNWVGNCNELNAAYSADGYARTARRSPKDGAKPGRGKVAALVTTFGVGELSALNGIAGSFAERLPIVHIVGVPSTSAQDNHALLHHTLGDGRFDAFEEMSKKISISVAKLEDHVDDPTFTVKALDRTLTIGFRTARPVYISLPTDMVNIKVPSRPLETPLDIEPLKNEEQSEADCLKQVMNRINLAKDPIIIVDACAIRHDVLQETLDLVDSSGFSIFATPMGKSAFDEGHAQYGGIYVGSNTLPEIKQRVESADLLIQIGSLLSDFNTANFSYRTPKSQTIQFHSDRIQIGYAIYQDVGMKRFLPKVCAQLESRRKERLDFTKSRLPKFENILPSRQDEIKNGAPENGDPDQITQAWLWPRLGFFIKEGDQILAETGTSSFGSLVIKLPSSKIPSFHSQVLWGSIGWSVGACLGVALAAREEKLGRVMLFVGDGSFQLSESAGGDKNPAFSLVPPQEALGNTIALVLNKAFIGPKSFTAAQEVSTMVREGLNPILFVLSNDGYEIERQIHGPNRRYNNTARWNFKSFVETFDDVNKTNDVSVGGVNKNGQTDFKKSHAGDRQQSKVEYHAVKSKSDMDKLLDNDNFANSKALRFVEIYLARGDAPKALLGQANATQESNRY